VARSHVYASSSRRVFGAPVHADSPDPGLQSWLWYRLCRYMNAESLIGDEGALKALSSKALWSVIRDAHSVSALSKAICWNYSIVKARRESLAVGTYVRIRQQRKRLSPAARLDHRPEQTQGLDVKKQKQLRLRTAGFAYSRERGVLFSAEPRPGPTLPRGAQSRQCARLCCRRRRLAPRLFSIEHSHLAALLAILLKARIVSQLCGGRRRSGSSSSRCSSL